MAEVYKAFLMIYIMEVDQ